MYHQATGRGYRCSSIWERYGFGWTSWIGLTGLRVGFALAASRFQAGER